MTPEDDADVGIIPVAELGAWAERGEAVPVPANLRAADHPFQWAGLISAYREQLLEWGGQARAIPLAGDGFVVLYRADRLADPKFVDAFRKNNPRTPSAPTTWEEFANLARTFTELDGKPSIAPMTNAEAATLFFRIASCYERPALNDALIAQRKGSLEDVSFQFNLATGDPQLTTPGFRAAATWFAELKAANCFAPVPPGADVASALADGQASLAVVSLTDLARLPREKGAVPTRFGLTQLPGTAKYVDKGQMASSPTPNYVPYFTGGRLGVVRTRCKRPDAAFDLLAELGGPVRSLEVVATPGLGAGPFRQAHLDRERLQIWYGYGFDNERSKLLQSAMHQYVRQDARNATIGLRGPDQAQLNLAATEELGKLLTSKSPPETVLRQLEATWKGIDAKTPRETRIRWRKLAAGLN